MQIMIVNGPKVLVHADIDVPSRKVVSLLLDDEDPLGGVFIGLALLESHIEEELRNRTNKADVANRDTMVIVGSKAEAQELSEARVKPVLTNQEMATAMGLVPCRAEWDSACECCDEASIDWMKREGQVLVGYCNACLPAAFDLHVINQAELDRLVEAEEPARRPEPPTCEGGCE